MAQLDTWYTHPRIEEPQGSHMEPGEAPRPTQDRPLITDYASI